MAGETYRVILHFRSNFDGKPDKAYVERYVTDYLRSMQGLGQVIDVEVFYMDEAPESGLEPVQERTTIPAPPAPSEEVPAVIIEEPDTGRKTRIPGTGE